MNTEKCNLQWHTYPDHLTDMLHKLMVSKELTDITLVCDDKKQFKAHKIVLSACSPVFKDIINGLPQNSSVIYLRGIEHQEIESILEFMYLGVATFYQDRINEFLNVAKNLEIKEISKSSEFDEENDSTQDIPDIENENNLLCEKRQKKTHMIIKMRFLSVIVLIGQMRYNMRKIWKACMSVTSVRVNLH